MPASGPLLSPVKAAETEHQWLTYIYAFGRISA